MTTNGAEGLVMNSPPIIENNTVIIKGKRYRQRPLGPAPFASFEDSSDELDSPPETARAPGLPNIKEDPASQLPTPVSPRPLNMNVLNLTEEEEKGLQDALSGGLDTPAPPRIDISRASSSSQHEDSVTSSPDAEGPHNLGYKEDGALDLRSSTEELDYTQESGTVEETETKRKRDRMMRKQHQLKQDFGDTQSEHDFKERKDSNCSVLSDFGGHLYIGGRTSRLSSVGSAASGGSVASAASHLSVGSKMSRGSRSPSPHKMMLETSFCGGKPAGPTQIIDADAAPKLVSHVEKPSSRPPSRLRSRSPSPHKMLLETSFCGTKAIAASAKSQESNQVVRRRSSNTLTPDMITAVEINQISPTVKEPVEPVLEKTKTKPIEIVKPKQVLKKEPIKPELDEIRKADEKSEIVPRKTKPVNLAKMMEQKIQRENKAKSKKVVSLRDIPGNEIYIPLTGPEVDFEEIIRKASPKLTRREPSEESPNIIFIPLHSPPKEKDIEAEVRSINDSIRPPISGTRSSGASPKPYEVCEDGSIFIPLHTPEEEKSSRTFEEEIRRVEKELERVKAVEAERRQREREQQKPATLDLTDNRSRLSQSYPGNKPELLSGSRTPSPGSSLSRKSSFASLFRRSELTASPDSPAGSSARKKSATLSNILKDATEGLRDRSRSRSKSKERLPTSTGVSRSPSFKKNVLGGLFSKKRDDGRNSDASEHDAPPMDVQFTFASGATFQGEDRGDYIFIPLRDPNKPYHEDPPEPEPTHLKDDAIHIEQPLIIEEIKDSPSQKRRSRELKENEINVPREESTLFLSTVDAAYVPAQPTQKLSNEKISPEESSLHQSSSRQSLGSRKMQKTDVEPQEIVSTPEPTEIPVEDRISSPAQELAVVDDIIPPSSSKPSLYPRGLDGSLQDSSVELDDDPPREEIVTVSTDGVRKLKLPPEPGDLEEDHERKGLVVQDSFEEELPYVPTTLPMERSLGVTLVPAKERISEVKTCPIDRPRSTTPKNPASLDDYLARRDSSRVHDKEKMKISLPREGPVTGAVKSPRRFSGKGKSWFEFAEEGLQSPRELRKGSLTKSPSPPPPPLPPRAEVPVASPQDFTACAATSPVATWINFEELPEKRKLPKRITTLPTHRSPADGVMNAEKSSAPVVFSYVNPEDCQCECHDHSSGAHFHGKPKLVAGIHQRKETQDLGTTGEVNGLVDEDDECVECGCELGGEMEGADEDGVVGELDECPLLDGNSDEESTSRKEPEWITPGTRLEIEQPTLSDSSFEVVSIGPDNSPSENAAEMIPFAMDLDMHSNRSSIISQNEEPSPDGPPT